MITSDVTHSIEKSLIIRSMNKDLLDLYTDYLICSTEQTTATELSRMLDGHVSHNQVTHFLSSQSEQ